MISQRLMAFSLLIIQCATVMFMAHTYAFPVGALIVGAVAASGRVRPAWIREQRLWIILALVLIFALLGSFAPNQSALKSAFVSIGMFYAVVQFSIALQIYLLFIMRQMVPDAFPVFGAVAMIFAGNVRVGPRDHEYQFLTFLFVAALAVLLQSQGPVRPHPSKRATRNKRIMLSLVLAVTLLGSYGSSTALYAYRSQLDTAFVRLVGLAAPLQQSGFSRTSRLDSVARIRTTEDVVALRVVADQAPGYLRGAVYEIFDGRQWRSDARKRTLSPVLPELVPVTDVPLDQSVFVVKQGAPSPDSWQVWPEVNSEGALFVPPDTAAVSIDSLGITVDQHGAIDDKNMATGQSYHIWREQQPDETPPDSATRKRLLTVPKNLDPRIRELARTIFVNASTPMKKIHAVVNYFQHNYKYQLGIRIPNGLEPLNYFLLNRPPAHCEYFASGAAILLRLAGIPCRYVTGFVTTEEQPLGSYWIARNKDAHAWVEAWVPGEGWTLVEATPADGIPHPEHASMLAYLWDFVGQTFRELREALAAGQPHLFWHRLVSAVTTLIGNMPIVPAVLILATLLAVFIVRNLHLRRATPEGPTISREQAALGRLLHKADKRLASHGIRRQPHETVHQFAARLAAMADLDMANEFVAWYREYGVIRYGQPVTADVVARLETQLPGTSREKTVNVSKE